MIIGGEFYDRFVGVIYPQRKCVALDDSSTVPSMPKAQPKTPVEMEATEVPLRRQEIDSPLAKLVREEQIPAGETREKEKYWSKYNR